MPINLTCKDVHQLASESMDRSLTMGERVRFQAHLLGCPGCRHFEGQLRLIRLAMHRIEPTSPDIQIPESE